MARHHCIDGLPEQLAIVCEIGDNLQSVAKSDDGHEVGGSHLFVEILLRGARRSQQIFRLQRREVEEHDDHSVIAHDRLDFLGRGDGSERDGDGRVIRFAGGFDLLDVVVLERRDFLRLAVFDDAELFLRQPFHRLAVAVGDLHVDFHEADG